MAEEEPRNAVTVLWRIENFSYCQNMGLYIRSRDFTVHNLNENCALYLYSKALRGEDDSILLGYILTDIVEFSDRLNCECSVLDSHGSPLISEPVLQNETYIFTFNLFPDVTQEEFASRKHSFLTNDALTVRLRIWKARGDFEQMENISLVNTIKIKESSFPWPIKRFRSLKLGQEVDAPAKAEYNKIFELKFSLVGKSLIDSKIQFKVSLKSPAVHSSLNLKSSVYGATDSNELENINLSVDYWNNPNSFLSSISRKDLLDKFSSCLKDDVLTLHCTTVCSYCTKSITKHDLGSLYMYREREITRNGFVSTEVDLPTLMQNSDPPNVFVETSNSLDMLSRDYLFMYQEQTFSDFELRSGDISIPVHKNVLSARSPVFRAMFSSNMKESGSKFLDVPDLDTHTLNRFLTFLYTGTVEDMQWEVAAKLYYAADKYDVSSLKQLCTFTLRSSIALSNVCDILVLADTHQDQQLTTIAHDFILCDFEMVMHSEEWEIFMEKNTNLAGKTAHQLFKKKYKPKVNKKLGAGLKDVCFLRRKNLN